MKKHKLLRDSDIGLSQLFQNPPYGYGIVPFYWWLGDPLTRERLTYEVDRMKNHCLTGLQINYAHSCEGGRSYGLTYVSDPPIFSENWWDLVAYLMEMGKKEEFAVSLSDYTLGTPGQGYYVDEILAENPEMRGQLLRFGSEECTAGKEIGVSLPSGLLNASFLTQEGCTDLTGLVQNGALHWTPDKDGKLLWVWSEVQDYTLDPMHPLSGKKVCEKFFGRFEEHFPGEGGNGLNYFFSDELNFNIRGNLWNRFFAEEFKARKGYDLLPLLPAIFTDIGDITPKVRLDYYDVIVQLEENYFRTVYDWHESRGMVYGCDHGGRGYDITEFGDYFRTQRFNQGPGCDQPGLASDIVKNKVASSIAHLYERPRVWLEGFYGSGWGTSSSDFADAVARNFVMGHNLLSLHGLYYSTHGGWWEWAPPCNGYHMPYWEDMAGFFQGVERMSFLLSQGRHVCDVGIVYPVAAEEAGCGKEAANTAFAAAKSLYPQGIDLDFLDFESIERAEVRDKALEISGERYRVVIVPAMRAVRFGMMEKLLELKRQGGTVLFIGALPESSDHAGRNDPVFNAMVEELASVPGCCLSSAEEAAEAIRRIVPADVSAEGFDGEIYLNHRRIGPKDLYMIYGVPKGTRCTFRAEGTVSLWNPFDGKRYGLKADTQNGTTTLSLPLDAKEFQFLVFDHSGEQPDAAFPEEGRLLSKVALSDEWKFNLLPNLDNRFGDYALPASPEKIGPELRMAAYAESDGEIPPESAFDRVERFSYGPYWKVSGPFADEATFREACLSGMNGSWETFRDYEISMRYGIWNDPGLEGYHGLKARVTDDFLTVGQKKETMTGSEYIPDEKGFGRVYATFVNCPETGNYRLESGSMKPDFFALDGVEQPFPDGTIRLEKGLHRICAGYKSCGRTHLAVVLENAEPVSQDMAMRWYDYPGMADFDCMGENAQGKTGFFRFMSPPGLAELTIPCTSKSLRLWVDGKEIPAVHESESLWRIVLPEPAKVSVPAVLGMSLDCGRCGGALIEEAVKFRCEEGRIHSGDWGKIDGLSCYSGCAAYTQTVSLSEVLPEGRPVLRLEDAVSSVRVYVNGKPAGERVMAPWEFDLTGLIHPGDNELRLEISNTLANHYQSIPTRYRREAPSGLLGSSEILFIQG
ncbi:MAG: glycosyl hydrolase [Candidatus Merdivicinus sp.]|jgi:hypothetical protein